MTIVKHGVARAWSESAVEADYAETYRMTLWS